MMREEDAWTIDTKLRWKAGGYWTVISMAKIWRH